MLNCVLTCSRALRAYVLRWQRALRGYVLTWHVSCVLTGPRVIMPCVLTCSRALHVYVLTCPACSRAHVLTCFTCSRAITSNNKIKLGITCFTQIFGTFSLSFSCEIKLHIKSVRQAGMPLKTFILRIQWYIPVFFLPGGNL